MSSPSSASAATAASPSHVRVFVALNDDAVFAGDHVEATITFKNVNLPPRPPSASTSSSARNPPAPTSRRPSLTTSFIPSRPTHSRQPSLASQTTKAPELSPRSPSHGHRQVQSLNVLENGKADRKSAVRSAAAKSASHSRSVSIVSFGSDTTDTGKKGRPNSIQRNPARPGFKLTRSTSVQINPATSPRSPWPGGSLNNKPFPSPLSTAVSPPQDEGFANSPTIVTPDSAAFMNGGSIYKSPRPLQSRVTPGKGAQSSPFPPSSFKFPASPDPGIDSGAENGFARSPGSSAAPTPMRPAFPHTTSEPPAMLDPRGLDRKANSVNRVLSLSSETGTPRSSMDQTDMYSSSNHSDDTTTTDGARSAMSRIFGRPSFFRQPSQLSNVPRTRPPEQLMMGFVQVYGSFTVDGSLINQGPFEEVKRRAVVGGQGGGGVVGIERPKTESRLFGGFNWGGFSESIGGILGSNEPSSMREMKGKANSKSVPLLSTPKSILFVDLKLAPGESKSYTYKIPLPRRLPPSHRGRAMKIAYQLVIGTQRAGTGKAAREQQIRQVEVPFRLFGGVDARGDLWSHDLMSPYIVLKDEGLTAPLEQPGPKTLGDAQKAAKKPANSDEAEFNSYIQSLLKNPHRGSTASIISPINEALSPSESHSSLSAQLPQIALSTRALIDNAIRSSIQANPYGGPAQPTTSRTNFTIARGGQPIANLILSRPALRLGDLVHVTLDFGAASTALAAQRTPTLVHALTVTLESSETIDTALAVRSATSVERVTRRVWDRRIVGGANAAALSWCAKWSDSLKIPASATPAFSTTGVSCAWCVRVEIGVGVNTKGYGGLEPPDDEDEDDDPDQLHDPETSTQSSAPASPAPEKPPRPPSRPRPSRQSTVRRRARSQMLLEPIAEDERGAVAAGVRQVGCETFEIAVPIRVFGAVGATDMASREVHDVEGLSI